MMSEVFVSKKTARSLSGVTQDKIVECLVKLVDGAENFGKTAASASEVIKNDLDTGGYEYSFTITLENNQGRSDNSRSKHIGNAKEAIKTRAEKEKWEVKYEEEAAIISEYVPLHVPEHISEDMEEFDGIYERGPHLRIINSGVQTFVQTKGKVREHTILFGDPASCKTKMFLALKKLYEKEDSYCEKVMVLNSTTMSKAGLENLLVDKAEKKITPEIIMFDEIEKCDPNTLSCLLEIMDGQGRVSRTNSKVGAISYPISSMVWATTNNVQKIKGWFDGALFSRFTKKLPCVRPSKELMKLILRKELERWEKVFLNKVDYKWIDIIMKHSEEKKITDPREILGLLNGRSRLNDGSYLRDIEDIEKVRKQAELAAKL